MSSFAAVTPDRSAVPYFSYVPPAAPESSAKDLNQVQVRRLFIDNRDRNVVNSKSEFDFKVYFGNDPDRSVGIEGYSNVLSVELKAIAFPKVQDERYVIVSIDELNDNMMDATSQSAHNAFAIAFFDSDALSTGAVKPLKGADFYQKNIQFKPPLSKLKQLSVRFLKHDGSVVTTSDTGNVSHVSLLLEVTSRVARAI